MARFARLDVDFVRAERARRHVELALNRRTASALAGPNGRRARPVVIKVIAGVKSPSDARGVLRYIARLGADKKDPLSGEGIRDPVVTVYDERGIRIERPRVLEALSDWDLTPDGENLSRKARDMLDEGASRAELRRTLGKSERLRNVQAWHLVFTVPVARDSSDGQRLEAAVAATLRETFAEWGFRCLWARHAEHGSHQHVHVLVRALNDDADDMPRRRRIADVERDPGRMRRMRFARDGLLIDALRAVLADHANDFKLTTTVEATRHADRPEETSDLLAGRRSARSVPLWNRLEGVSGLDRLRRRVPTWTHEHGAAYVSRATARAASRRRATDLADRRGGQGNGYFTAGWPAPEPAPEGRDGRSFLNRLLRRSADTAPEPDIVLSPLHEPLIAHLRTLGTFWDGMPAGQEAPARDATRDAVMRFERLRQADPGGAVRLLLDRPWAFGATARPRSPEDLDGGERRAVVRSQRSRVPGKLLDALPPIAPAPADHWDALTRHLRLLGVFVRADGRDVTTEALASFQAMRREDKALASWYLRHQPVAFGPVSAVSLRLDRDRRLKELIDALPPAPPAPPKTEQERLDERKLAEVQDLVLRDRTRHRYANALVVLADALELRFPQDPEQTKRAIRLRDEAYRLSSAPLTVEAATEIAGTRNRNSRGVARSHGSTAGRDRHGKE